MSKALIRGIGIYDPSGVSRSDAPRVYQRWHGMLHRTSEKNVQRAPWYAGTTVAPEFHRFSVFAEWAMAQIGYDTPGYQLDKDLLKKGNKVYSPDTCVFIPRSINSLLTKATRRRGDLPLGVRLDKFTGRFIAQISIDNKFVHIGQASTAEGAFLAYKAAKEANIKRMAEQYRSEIEPRAYAALMAYQVEIKD